MSPEPTAVATTVQVPSREVTPTRANSLSANATSSRTATSTTLPSATPTLTAAPTNTASPTSTDTVTPGPTSTSTATPSPSPTAVPTPTPTPAPVRAVRIDYADLSSSRPEVPSLVRRAQEAGVNLVALGAGRPDWAYFRWQGHETWWSADVRDTGIDFLAEDISSFQGLGAINAVVDVYAPEYISAHPGAAAISHWGEPSPLLVSTAALLDGPYHELLLDMIEYVAANYDVNSVSLTELSYRIYGYGPQDLALYQAHSGRGDWPRRGDGSVNIDEPSIGEWRSLAIAGFLAEAAARTHRHGVALWMDVEVSWGNLASEALEYGHHYPTLLGAADRLILWAYTGLSHYPASYTRELAAYLSNRHGPRQLILSEGMWDSGGGTISPGDLRTALQQAREGGLADLWVTPSHLISDAHWAVLPEAWGTP